MKFNKRFVEKQWIMRDPSVVFKLLSPNRNVREEIRGDVTCLDKVTLYNKHNVRKLLAVP